MTGRRHGTDGSLPPDRSSSARRTPAASSSSRRGAARLRRDATARRAAAAPDHREVAPRSSSRVAAPRQVGAPHLAALLTKARGAGEQQRGSLVRRAAAAVLGEERPVVERAAARMEFATPSAVERQQLTDVRRHGEGDGQVVDPVVVVALVGQLDGDRDGAAGVPGDACGESQPGDAVDGVDRQSVDTRCHRLGHEARRPTTAVTATPAEPRPPGETRPVLGHERHRCDDVETAGSRRQSPARRQSPPGRRRAPLPSARACRLPSPCRPGSWCCRHPGRRASGRHQPLVAPSVSPLMKCFWRAMYTANVGRAIMIEPAAMRL